MKANEALEKMIGDRRPGNSGRNQRNTEPEARHYRIVRYHYNQDHPDHLAIIKSGLTHDEASEYCQRDDTHELDDAGDVLWFDGKEIDDGRPRRRLAPLFDLWSDADREARDKDRQAEALTKHYPSTAATVYREAATLWRKTRDYARAMADDVADYDAESHAENSEAMARKLERKNQ